MPNIADVEYAAFARWAVGGVTIGVGTRDELRSGVEHAGVMLTDAALEDEFVEGIALGHPLRLTIADRVEPNDVLLDENGDPILDEMGDALYAENDAIGSIRYGIAGTAVTVEVETTVLWDDGTLTTQLVSKALTVQGSEDARGQTSLELVDLEDRLLDTLFPQYVMRPEDWPAVRSDDAGLPIPAIVLTNNGAVLKLPCVQIRNTAGDYGFLPVLDLVTVLSVYRNGRLVPSSEYTVEFDVHTTLGPYNYIKFTQEQIDFNGGRYTIEADVSGAGPSTPAYFIDRLAAFTPFAYDYTGALDMVELDACLGPKQRTARAWIEDMLALARGTLTRNSSGTYVLVQDKAGASTATFDADAGDRIEVLSVQRPAKPSSVSIRYRPSPRNPEELQHTITRTVTGGTLGAAQPIDIPYLYDHTEADKHLCYLAKRAEYSWRLKARVLATQLTIGQIITVTSSAEGLVGSTWTVWAVRQIPGGCEVECRQYHDDIHTYVAGTLPADASTVYQPDYSNTLPLAPTALTITAGTTVVANDGNTTARITAQCTAPSVNWEYVQFDVVHNTTGEIFGRVRGDTSGTTATATIPNLRPGEVYKLIARAVNAFGIEGVAQSTFNATAIGGPASTTTFTAPGHATVPATVGSCTAAQGTGLSIGVSWTAVTAANLAEYVVERQVNAAGYSEYWRGRTTNFIDRSVSYGSAYQYRVRARDTYGNFSAAYATSGSVTPAANIVGGSSGNDIQTNTIATVNRTAVSSISSTWNLSGLVAVNVPIAHGLGVIPNATLSANTNTDVIAHLPSVTSAQVNAQYNRPAGAGGPSDNGTATVYIW